MQASLSSKLSSDRVLRLVPWIFVVLWSTGFIGAKYGLPYSEPFTFLSWRMAGNLAVFLLLMRLFKVSFPKEPKLWLQQAIAGSLIHGAYLGGVFSAIETGASAGLTALLVSLQPILVAILMAFLYQNTPSMKQWTGLALGISGVCLVLVGGQADLLGGDLLSLSEFGWILLALFGITLGTLYQKKYCEPQSLLSASFIQYLATLAITLICVALWEEGTVEWHPEFIGAMAWSVLVLSVGAIMLLMLMIQAGEATKTASYFYLVPPFTAIEAWILFDEQFTLVALVGMAITVWGVYWVNKK